MLQIAMGEHDQAVRNEACWVVLNAASCGTDAQVVQLVRAGGLGVLAHLIGHKSTGTMAKEGLGRILQVMQRVATLERLLAAIQGQTTSDLVVSTSALRALQQAGGPVFAHVLHKTQEVDEQLRAAAESSAIGGSRAARTREVPGFEEAERLRNEINMMFDGIDSPQYFSWTFAETGAGRRSLGTSSQEVATQALRLQTELERNARELKRVRQAI